MRTYICDWSCIRTKAEVSARVKLLQARSNYPTDRPKAVLLLQFFFVCSITKTCLPIQIYRKFHLQKLKIFR